MTHAGWKRVSKTSPCPICAGVDNCNVSDDGNAIWCGRVSDGSEKQNAGGQWLHRFGKSDPSLNCEHRSHRREPDWSEKCKPDPQLQRDWQKLMRFSNDRPDIAAKRSMLAEQLGVSVTSLDRLQVGWCEKHSAWLFAERNGDGRIVGVTRRYLHGNKRLIAGGSRGLTFATDWQADEGPVLLVEGASDVAALLSLGICAVGRPSNSGGVPQMCELLRRLPMDREVIVLGENDRKHHDSLKPSIQARHSPNCEGCLTCWPGYAAFRVADQLAQALLRPIAVAFPPDDAKDVRDLLRKLERVT